MKLKEKFEELSKQHPEVALVLSGFFLELESVVHPSVSDDAKDDIEARLDAGYKEIIQDNKRSNTMKVLEKLLGSLLAHAAAKNGLKLP